MGLYDVIIVLIEKICVVVFFFDLAAMSSTFINSMIQIVALNDASCVVSPVLLMCGSIASVVMTYLHAVLRRFAFRVIVVNEAYGDTDA